ncbi:hypothetical protein [Streptomyces lydicus]|uniref:hypothetical protein n=1 Tax=Streptomyces lydicus TaxID=47763 RepID=UPI003798924B
MTEPRTLTLQTNAGPIDVQAHPTAAPGLYVYRDTDTWRLAHHTGHILGEFPINQHAYNAAWMLNGLTDWTQTAEQLRTDLSVFLYDLHDAVVDAGGTFLRTDDGPAAHALAARGD